MKSRRSGASRGIGACWATAVAARSSSNKRLAAAASASGIVVRHRNASVPNRKRRRRALHGHHGKLPGERIEHLDREPAFGTPGHPGSDRLRRGQAGEPVRRRCGRSEWNRRHRCRSARRRAGAGSDSVATRRRDAGSARRKIARASMSVLPALIAIEVASVEADVCLGGEAERGAGFIACRGGVLQAGTRGLAGTERLVRGAGQAKARLLRRPRRARRRAPRRAWRLR